jgi:hypothetical protein
VSLSGEPEAVLTNSTPGLWNALKDEGSFYSRSGKMLADKTRYLKYDFVLIKSYSAFWFITIDINYEQLPNLGGKVAVNNFSSKHDLDHLEDQDENET